MFVPGNTFNPSPLKLAKIVWMLKISSAKHFARVFNLLVKSMYEMIMSNNTESYALCQQFSFEILRTLSAQSSPRKTVDSVLIQLRGEGLNIKVQSQYNCQNTIAKQAISTSSQQYVKKNPPILQLLFAVQFNHVILQQR